jgi:hypothetical protein
VYRERFSTNDRMPVMTDPIYDAVCKITTYIRSTFKKPREEVEVPSVSAKKRCLADECDAPLPVQVFEPEQVEEAPVVVQHVEEEPVVVQHVEEAPVVVQHVEDVEPRRSARARVTPKKFKARA